MRRVFIIELFANRNPMTCCSITTILIHTRSNKNWNSINRFIDKDSNNCVKTGRDWKIVQFGGTLLIIYIVYCTLLLCWINSQKMGKLNWLNDLSQFQVIFVFNQGNNVGKFSLIENIILESPAQTFDLFYGESTIAED